MQIQYTSQFSQQLANIINNIEVYRGNQAATNYLLAIDKAINKLGNYPEVHAVCYVGKSSHNKYRRINIKEYSTFYCYNKHLQITTITDIYHSKQDIVSLLH